LGFKEFKEYVEKHYRLWHTPTLSLSEENIVQAYITYQYGVQLGLTLRSAVIQVVGYRYRRLENFILNAALYDTKKHAWVHVNSLVKVKALYESKKKGTELYEFQIETFRPFHLQRLDERFCEFIFFDCLEKTPFSGVIEARLERWAYDDLDRYTYLPYGECTQKNEAVMDVEVKGNHYEYVFQVEVSNYSVFELLKEGCSQHLHVRLLEERIL
jgi:hypothetical protein